MAYVDGFVAAVETARKEEYKAFCERVGAFFARHGALDVRDCWGEEVPDGKLTSFPMAVKKAENETVAFGWVVWPDKDTRNAAFRSMEDDPAFNTNGPMPFDGKRMIFGGFEPISEHHG